ncbi:hypothetical protein Cgig2_015800 [Carnegiea gigantea]|uniref:Mediator of RNA polymerase II transcription subunit 13 n=1 Tax=Carnegiea gigantea TaxID=171969 RepID=A0A9Q1KI72_9CARY|nr:hypothetical protein Cgig2_015800 [Carnegiea gigantea]
MPTAWRFSFKAVQKETATLEVLSSHLQLQKEGFLSTWTNSFVGPWDPSQGIHNPVVASGLWVSPGDSEEVATALSQALKNQLERHVRALSNGDMEKVLRLSSDSLRQILPVIVSPHGMRGKITGCCSSDLVKHVYAGSGTARASAGLAGLPDRISQAPGCKLQGQNCYVEVTLGCSISENIKENSNSNGPAHPISDTASMARGSPKGSSGDAPVVV